MVPLKPDLTVEPTGATKAVEAYRARWTVPGRRVLACVDSDAENIFATLTARELRPDIPIVARAAVESSERKLIRAGANEVVSPYKASGRTMASLALIERGDDSASRHMRDGGAVTSRTSAAT